MVPKDLLTYQFGNAEAIRRLAGGTYLLPVGAALVLITSVPRNYDQTYIGEVPWWPVIPLAFSLFSGSFLFLVLQSAFLREADAKWSTKYALFLGLFWMTAPVAWLYGIPFERILDARAATIANLWLLGLVSVWRVVLVTRVLTVVFSAPWLRAGGWVLLARGMGGMRNSPEQDLILDVLDAVFATCLFAAPLLLIVMLATLRFFRQKARSSELPSDRRVPVVSLAIAAVVWICLAIQPQRELAKEYYYRSLLREKNFSGALAYLNLLEPVDWPPAKSFRPDPYEGEVREWLPSLMAEVTGKEKPWVQQKLVWVFERTFDHRSSVYSADELVKILKGVE